MLTHLIALLLAFLMFLAAYIIALVAFRALEWWLDFFQSNHYIQRIFKIKETDR